MTNYRYVRSPLSDALERVPSSTGISAAGIANAVVGIEAFRSVRFEDLPHAVIQQLQRDGTRGDPRNLDGAWDVFHQDIPAEARGSLGGVEAITNDPGIHWMHQEPHAAGGGHEAANGLYGPADLNQQIGDRPMTSAEVTEAQDSMRGVAEVATPGVTGDLGEVIGETLETGAWAGVMGSGVAVAHRWAQVKGYRDAGRDDLADAARERMLDDAAQGAVSGVVRGGVVAVTQAVLGANPLTAGIGLVAPDALMLLQQRHVLSEQEYSRRAAAVVGKGTLATALVCSGPIGWAGLLGLSVASAYGKATKQAARSVQQQV